MLKRAAISDVKILPGLFRSRMKLNEDYLMELDSVCLLQNFYLEAGIQLPGQQSVPDPASAKLHWGWEAPICRSPVCERKSSAAESQTRMDRF